jgi:hypothetical protein
MYEGVPIDIDNRRRTQTSLHASDYSVTICGDAQPAVIRRLLQSGSEGENGWACRFLWVFSRRQRFIPSGGNIHVLDPFLQPLKYALDFA